MCDWKPDFDAVNERVTKIEGRMAQVEHDMGKMRTETQDGFKAGAAQMNAINAAVTNLGHDFGERMNGFDKRLVTEKEKWGETLRKILTWGAKALILGALVAMGVNIANSVIKSFFTGGG